MRSLFYGVVVMTGVLMIGCAADPFVDKAPTEHVRAQLAKLADVELQTDVGGLSAGDLKALAKLHDAAKIIDELFLLQVDADNPRIRQELHQAKLPDHLALFDIMFGKWNRLVENEPFLDLEEKPRGAGFYPVDMSREEFESYLIAHPEKSMEFKSEFTVIRRQEGDLVAVPYHIAYQSQVDQVAALLKEAAQLTDDPTLATFLNLRSQAFLTDDYFASDMAWMDLAGDLEIVIAPYEVYEDEMFNYKAAYEAFLCRVDHEESAKLETVAHYLNEMEANLPIADSYKNYNRGASSPIKVVNELFAAGDTKAGIQTTAFNLPNDERVREAKGSKKVMLKNIARAKFDKCWIPIVNTILAEEPLQRVSFEAYFNHVLMHEVSHGLGPGNITLANGRATSVRDELKELYSIMEECKADILGIWNLKFLIDKGVFPQQLEESMYASYLGGMFRSIRFGIDEAHGAGVAIQFNYLMENGAFYVDADGKLNYDVDKFWPAIGDLARSVLMLQARGDYDGSAALINTYRTLTPVMENYIDQLKDVPVDIKPIFTLEEKLEAM
ncbi:peptidase [candidate division KSB1 bacterium]|nr:peptidase [candidate division KSB1 bacterium]